MTGFKDWAGQYTGNKPSTVEQVNSQMNFQPHIRTNKVFVNGLQGALNMPSPANSEMVYFEQDPSKPIIYVIRTDMYGMQSYTIFNYNIDEATNSENVLRQEFEELKERVNKLESLKEVKYETSK